MKTGTINNNKQILSPLYRNAFFVICLLELINSAASLTDSYFIGNYIGSIGMAAMGYARPFFSFVDIISGPLGLGMQLVCSHYIGKGDFRNAQNIFSGSLSIGLAVSALLAVFGFAFSPLIASMYGTGANTAEVLPLAEMYLKGLFIGVPAMVVFGILSPIVQLGNGEKTVTMSILFQLFADVAGNALSVFVFNGGMFGLGLATAVSYYFSLVPFIAYFLQREKILNLQLSLMPVSDLMKISTAGMSKSIKRLCNTVKPVILNALSLLLGTSLALSVYSITNQVRDLLISFSAGATSAVVLIGVVLFSQQDRDGLKTLSELGIKAIHLISVLGCLCIIFSERIAGFFISDSEEVLKIAAMSIRCVGFMIPFSAFNGMFIAFQQVMQRFRLVNFLSFLNRLFLIVTISALFGFLFGTNGLWWALPVSELLNAVISLLTVKRITGRMPRNAYDMLCLPADFGFSTGDFIEVSISSMEEIFALRDMVKEFCDNHGTDARRSFFAQLALEELGMNVLRHGFPKCRRKPEIHVRVIYTKGNINLRFQDNCPGFNVMKFCSELQQESPEHCVGLRLVSKIAKDMSYVNSLGTNNLLITI